MSDILMCPCCGKVYRKIFINEDFMMCPDIECDSCDIELFEIDELMIEPIRILNRKGYETKFCCSGHIYSPDVGAYIYFDESVELPSIPEGWNNEEHIIRCEDTLFDNEIYMNLLEWCMSLPSIT